MKRILLIMVALLIATTGLYAYDFTVDGIFYKITSKTDFTCGVTYNNGGTYNSYSGEIIIPERVLYNNIEYIVTSIEYTAFKGCQRLRSVKMPETIESIGSCAFMDCILLHDISIPSNVTDIPLSCFKDCISLENITLGKISDIRNSAFEGCLSLEKILIPASITKIEWEAFKGCLSLKEVIFEDGVETLNFGELHRSCDFFY